MSRYTVVCRTRKYGVKAIITITILFILVLFEVLGGRSYFDEILGLCGMLYMILLLFARRLTNEDKISVLLLLTVICIGVLSNVYSKINVSIYSVLVDLVVESKFLWVFFATKYFVTKVEMKDVRTPEKTTEKTNAPKTGDNQKVWAFVLLALASAGTVTGVNVYRRKKSRMTENKEETEEK